MAGVLTTGLVESNDSLLLRSAVNIDVYAIYTVHYTDASGP